jgi:hypothetical protein
MITKLDTMENKIKKIKDVFITPKTLNKNFPKSCVVVGCDSIDIKIDSDDDLKFRLRKVDGIRYEVFSTDERHFNIYLQRVVVNGGVNE